MEKKLVPLIEVVLEGLKFISRGGAYEDWLESNEAFQKHYLDHITRADLSENQIEEGIFVLKSLYWPKFLQAHPQHP